MEILNKGCISVDNTFQLVGDHFKSCVETYYYPIYDLYFQLCYTTIEKVWIVSCKDPKHIIRGSNRYSSKNEVYKYILNVIEEYSNMLEYSRQIEKFNEMLDKCNKKINSYYGPANI